MRSKLAPVLLLFWIVQSLSFGQGLFTLSGRVSDAQSAESLAAVNIRIAGTPLGTITNSNGEYRLSVAAGYQTIIYSSVSYQPETLRVLVNRNLVHDAALTPSPVQVAEMVVLAEDPALEIIRKAIANKHRWMDKLKSYRFEAFTRQILQRDTSIASITEAYTTGYMLTGDTLREVVRQRRQTQNIPMDENFAAVRGVLNFNEDEISLFRLAVDGNSSRYLFVGPTAPDALDNYDFKLLKTTVINGVEVYQIRMIPKSRLKPLFDGTIFIADGTFAVMGVDVKPNETFNIPFVREINLRYRQQFSLYGDVFWMPTDIRITGSLRISIIGFSLPRIGIDQTSTIYDYAINLTIPDSVLHKSRLEVDSSAAVFDSTFWKNHEVLPLTTREEAAYRTLDSTQTLEKQFQPQGILASLGGNTTSSVLGSLDLRFNRVEGFFGGAKTELDSLIPHTQIRASMGYGFSDSLVKYQLGGTYFPSGIRGLGFGMDMYRRLENTPDENYYGYFFNSLTALIAKSDYGNYFFATGWTAFAVSRPSARVHLSLAFMDEHQYSVSSKTSYGLFDRQTPFRPNPPITDGWMRSVRFNVRLGPAPQPLDIVSRNAFEASVEHSSPSFAQSDFEFTRYSGMVQWNFTTFSRSLLFPPTLRVKLSAGTSSGALPPQRIFTLDSRSTGYAPSGVLKGGDVKEFAGDRFIMLNVEHNFRNVPFLALNIPSLYSNGIELIVHGSVAQTWYGSASTSGGWYGEAGIGVSRILDLLRADLTYRFKEPKRFFFTISLATLF